MKHTPGERKKTRLYYHKTDGGAKYLSPIAVPGTDEGAFEGAPFIIRLDGKPEFTGASVSLLAAAPELLEALKDILHQISTDSDLDLLVTAPGKYDALETMIREVISKAEA